MTRNKLVLTTLHISKHKKKEHEGTQSRKTNTCSRKKGSRKSPPGRKRGPAESKRTPRQPQLSQRGTLKDTILSRVRASQNRPHDQNAKIPRMTTRPEQNASYNERHTERIVGTALNHNHRPGPHREDVCSVWATFSECEQKK